MFKLLENIYKTEECSYIGYDIIGNFDNEEVIFKDISCNCGAIKAFVDKLNNGQVDKVHFFDVVYDFVLQL